MKPRPVIVRNQQGFSLMELLVVIAITTVLLSLLLPSLNRAKETGRSAVCRNNLHQLMVASDMYTLDNDDHLAWPGSADRVGHNYQPDWVFGGMYTVTATDPKVWSLPGFAIHAEAGSLFSYVSGNSRMEFNLRNTNTYTVYRCPSSGNLGRARRVTYGMNVRFDPIEETTIRGAGLAKTEIVKPTQKVLFVDASASTAYSGAYYPWGSQYQSQMQPHSERVNIGYVDNHIDVVKYQKLLEWQSSAVKLSSFFDPYAP